MAAELIERVAFDAPHQDPDGFGGVETGWRERHVARAHFRYLRGGESVQAARLAGRQPVVVTVRNCAAVRAASPGWRLRDLRREAWGEDGAPLAGVYNIRSGPVVSDDRQWLEFTCEAGVAV